MGEGRLDRAGQLWDAYLAGTYLFSFIVLETVPPDEGFLHPSHYIKHVCVSLDTDVISAFYEFMLEDGSGSWEEMLFFFRVL